jgi:hypothetical protein
MNFNMPYSQSFQVLTFINPNTKVRTTKDGNLFPAIAVKVTVLDEIDDVERYVSVFYVLHLFLVRIKG